MGVVYQFPFPRQSGLNLEPEYLHLQEHEPVARIEMPFGERAWLLTRYDDVKLALTDPRFSRAETLRRDTPRVTPTYFSGGIVAMDPPQHTRLRAVAGNAFGARNMERLRRTAECVAAELLDSLFDSDDCDFVEGFALPFTLRMVCELLGVPFEDHIRFRQWAESGLATGAVTEDERWEATGQMWDYIAGLISERRRDPRDDLISRMSIAADRDDEISDNDIVMLTMAVLVAGYETTATQLPNFLYLLLHDRRHFEQLVNEPGLVTTAVEELMRYVPLQSNGSSPRYLRDDLTIGPVRLRAGDAVVPAGVIANRDPEYFSNGHSLDLRRRPNPHLGFGNGPHFCLGAPLARVEMSAALNVLAAKAADLRLNSAGQIQWKHDMMVRGPAHLPVMRP
ncbi:cytochrome P450 [Antrihabitans spumae]|uniref:Cytochrome P450 n=1 Tax=Antrihabitans spumae TaxID=3373370 RepID=A0ABW7KU09_9NOCA